MSDLGRWATEEYRLDCPSDDVEDVKNAEKLADQKEDIL
jgi:endogenous inhibitor of DNA gyrase (YacG/DUF329 family)